MTSRKLASIAIKKGATQKITELSPLINLLKKRKLSTVVEIGTERGGTLCAKRHWSGNACTGLSSLAISQEMFLGYDRYLRLA